MTGVIALPAFAFAQPDCSSMNPNWSPDGSRLVFDGTRDGKQGIYIYDIKTRKTTMLIDRPGRDAHACWFHDGKRLAFQSQRDSSASHVVDGVYDSKKWKALKKNYRNAGLYRARCR